MLGIRCKGLCQTWELGVIKLTGRYNRGQKRCSICDIFLKTQKIRCPCCNYVLRTRPKNKKQSFQSKNLLIFSQ